MRHGNCIGNGYRVLAETQEMEINFCGPFTFNVYDCAAGYTCDACEWFFAITEEDQCGDICLFPSGYPSEDCDRGALADTVNMKSGFCKAIGYTKHSGSKTVNAGETCGTLSFAIYDCKPGYNCADCKWFYHISEDKCADACIYERSTCDREALAEAEHLKAGDCESQGFTEIDDTKDVDGSKWSCEETSFEIYVQPHQPTIEPLLGQTVALQ